MGGAPPSANFIRRMRRMVMTSREVVNGSVVATAAVLMMAEQEHC